RHPVPRPPPRAPPRREPETLEILHERGQATAAEVQERLPDPPGYSAVRKLLELLEKKQLVTHSTDGRRFVFAPATPPAEASRSALRRVVQTFFAGSVEQAVAALISTSDRDIDEQAVKDILRQSRRSRNAGR